MNVPVRELRALNNQIFRCGKVYYSNPIIVTNPMETLLSNYWLENFLSTYVCIKIS